MTANDCTIKDREMNRRIEKDEDAKNREMKRQTKAV